MSYKIQVDYETGDSFGKEDTSIVLELSWEKAEIAKENLVRIKEHYEWICSKESRWEDDLPKPKWLPKNKDDFHNQHYLPILLDDGSEVEICASWTGYFETLYGAKIISDLEDGWSFRL